MVIVFTCDLPDELLMPIVKDESFWTFLNAGAWSLDDVLACKRAIFLVRASLDAASRNGVEYSAKRWNTFFDCYDGLGDVAKHLVEQMWSRVHLLYLRRQPSMGETTTVAACDASWCAAVLRKSLQHENPNQRRIHLLKILNYPFDFEKKHAPFSSSILFDVLVPALADEAMYKAEVVSVKGTWQILQATRTEIESAFCSFLKRACFPNFVRDYLARVHSLCVKQECSVDVAGVLLAPIPASAPSALDDSCLKLLEGIVDSQLQSIRITGWRARAHVLFETVLRIVMQHCTFGSDVSYNAVAQLLFLIPVDCILSADFRSWLGEERLSSCVASAMESYLNGDASLDVRPHVYMWCLLEDKARISESVLPFLAASLKGAYSQSYAPADRKMRALVLISDILCMGPACCILRAQVILFSPYLVEGMAAGGARARCSFI